MSRDGGCPAGAKDGLRLACDELVVEVLRRRVLQLAKKNQLANADARDTATVMTAMHSWSCGTRGRRSSAGVWNWCGRPPSGTPHRLPRR
ncbi:hypothetical protein [Promicromonospora panici]|uniref:hypothetical protein n=1 Tax=Promicromonospora panici TaxID=2219658 RepID=UPI00101D32E5|nr:hypothetical protein [Promicromonospora panici]